MPAGEYSFIDIAVQDEVREHFARGDALAILTVSLEEIVWANGPGAALFGYPDIETIMGAPSGLAPAARRQIAATTGYPAIGYERPTAVRLAGDISGRATDFLASEFQLPDGQPAIMLMRRAPSHLLQSPEAIAAHAIEGITNLGHYAAMVDRSGDVLAASEGFGALGITRDAVRQLIIEVAAELGRVVKRMVPAGRGSLPCGFARLSDDPAQHFMIVVDEAALGFDEEEDETPSQQSSSADAITPAIDHDLASHDDDARVEAMPDEVEGFTTQAGFKHADASEATAVDTAMETVPEPEPEPLATPEVPAADDDVVEPVPAMPDTPAVDAPRDAEPATGSQAASASDSSAPAERPVDASPVVVPPVLPSAAAPAPIRFVWRTDADGRLVSMSPEFVAAVGMRESDIIGQPFRAMSDRLGLDPSAEIAGLLARRDTWSGRTVLWPLAASGRAVPVDLAALPVYGRDRNFEGFRGFGVARMADATERPAPAIVDPDPAPEPEDQLDPFQGERPALTVAATAERRFTDKVIKLAEHRAPLPERTLSPTERVAFREIGDRLKDETGRPAEDGSSFPRTTVYRPDPVAPVADEPAAGAGTPPLPGEPPAPQTMVPGQDQVPSPDAGPAVVSQGPASSTAPAPVAADEPEPAAPIDASQPESVDKPAAPDTRIRPSRNRDVIPSAFAFTPAAATRSSSPVKTDAVPEVPSDRAGPGPRADTTILARLPMPLLIHSGDVLHFANAAFLDLTGYGSLEDLTQAGGLDELFADTVDDPSAGDRRELVLRKRDGSMIPVDAMLHAVPWEGSRALMLALRDSSSDPVSFAGIARARVNPLDSELRARVAEMRTILDTATDGVVLIAGDFSIRSVNRPGEALFGFESDELVGKPFTTLFAVESQRAAREYLEGLAGSGVAAVLNDGREVIGRESQGRFIPLFMTIGRLPGEGGFCAVMRDITSWKRAEEELTQARAQAERASSQKTEFLARISHEIRTPLNAIIGFSELMLDEKFGPIGSDRYRDYLRDINRSGALVLDLVNDLLDITKIEAGEQEMSFEAVSLNEALGEIVAMMQPQANRERVIIRSSFASRLPEIVADPRSVRQIALNLLSNAIRYTPAGGQVIVSTAYEASGDVILRVRDTGVGMSAPEIQEAMKPFKQVGGARRGRHDGTGLGLPLTKAMVEANRARLDIVSTPGEGTLVEIVFPPTRVLAD